MKVNIEVRGVDIEGRLSELLRGIPNFSKVALDCVGIPINDSNGNTIGKINNIDIGLDKWYGRIITDSSIFDAVSKSFELKEGKDDEKSN